MAAPPERAATAQRSGSGYDADNYARLHDYFVLKDWALNTNLPRGNVFANSKLGKMATDLGLSRDQVRNQLVNYKEAKYGNSQIEMLINANKLEEFLGGPSSS